MLVRPEDLSPELAELVGPLHGKDFIDEAVLRRLRDLSPYFRVTWANPRPDVFVTHHKTMQRSLVPGQPGLWWLWEIRPRNALDELRRKAGGLRMQWYLRLSANRQRAKGGVPEMCEAMSLGFYGVGYWEETAREMRDERTNAVIGVVPPWGTDGFFDQVIQGLEISREEWTRSCNEVAVDQVLGADEVDPEYTAAIQDHLRQAAWEDYPRIFRERVTITMPGLRPDAPKEAVTP